MNALQARICVVFQRVDSRGKLYITVSWRHRFSKVYHDRNFSFRVYGPSVTELERWVPSESILCLLTLVCHQQKYSMNHTSEFKSRSILLLTIFWYLIDSPVPPPFYRRKNYARRLLSTPAKKFRRTACDLCRGKSITLLVTNPYKYLYRKARKVRQETRQCTLWALQKGRCTLYYLWVKWGTSCLTRPPMVQWLTILIVRKGRGGTRLSTIMISCRS